MRDICPEITVIRIAVHSSHNLITYNLKSYVKTTAFLYIFLKKHWFSAYIFDSFLKLVPVMYHIHLHSKRTETLLYNKRKSKLRNYPVEKIKTCVSYVFISHRSNYSRYHFYLLTAIMTVIPSPYFFIGC